MENKIRLSKHLAAAGIASRRAAEELIFEGRVSVNGEVKLLPQTLVGAQDEIALDGKRIGSTEPKVYYIFNKPAGYICTSKKFGNSKIVLDLFQDCPYRI